MDRLAQEAILSPYNACSNKRHCRSALKTIESLREQLAAAEKIVEAANAVIDDNSPENRIRLKGALGRAEKLYPASPGIP